MKNNRLGALRNSKRLTQQEVADMLGEPKRTYASWERGERKIPNDILIKLADLYETTVDDIVGREIPERQLPDNIMPIPDMQSVPLLGDIACGTPITAEENLDGYVNVPVDVTCTFALRCKGDSMVPRVQDGDLVYIRQQEDVNDGQIAAVLIDNEATLKHVYHIPGGVQLVAENPDYPPMIYTGAACSSIRILGLAVAYQRLLV